MIIMVRIRCLECNTFVSVDGEIGGPQLDCPACQFSLYSGPVRNKTKDEIFGSPDNSYEDEQFRMSKRDFEDIFEGFNSPDFHISYFVTDPEKPKALREEMGIPENEEMLVDYNESAYSKKAAVVVMTSKGVYIKRPDQAIERFSYNGIVNVDAADSSVTLVDGRTISLPRPIIKKSAWESFFIFLECCARARRAETD